MTGRRHSPPRSRVASGSISNSVGPVIGFIKKTVTKWSSCTGPFGLTFIAHLITSSKISVSHISGTTGAKGHLKAPTGNKISGTGLFNIRKATISGTTVPAKYVNAGHSFNINSGKSSTLHVKATSGFCANAINVSDTAYFKGIYIASTPANLSITS